MSATATRPGWRATATESRSAAIAIAVAMALATVCAAVAFTAADRAPDMTSIVAAFGLAAALISLSVIDLRVQRLPDVLTLPLLATGLALTAARGSEDLFWHTAAAATGYIAFFALASLHRAVRGIDGLGRGDAKLLAAGGAWLGLEGLPTVVLIGSATALLAVAAAYILGHDVQRQRQIPFGPFLAVGIWYAWHFGPLLN